MSKGTTNVVVSLRKLIREGVYAPGERIGEQNIAERLGISRTPVRLAFRTLEEEGLLQRAGKRGYQVRKFNADDLICAVEVRGVLEGLAARRLVERGLPAEVRDQLQECVRDGENLLSKGYLTKEDIDEWIQINLKFHASIVESTGSTIIGEAIARNNHLPFASANSIIIDTDALDKEYRKLQMAQFQHHLIFQALTNNEGARAEMLMKEHAFVGVRYADVLGLDSV